MKRLAIIVTSLNIFACVLSFLMGVIFTTTHPAFAQQITVEQVNQALSLSRAASSQELQIKDALIVELTEKLKKAEAACVKP